MSSGSNQGKETKTKNKQQTLPNVYFSIQNLSLSVDGQPYVQIKEGINAHYAKAGIVFCIHTLDQVFRSIKETS